MADASEPWRPPGSRDDGGRTFANVFVLVGLVAMLVGAILIIAARETSTVDVEAGERAEVFRFTAPSWSALGHQMEAKVFAPANVTWHVEETSGTGETDTHWSNLTSGWALWKETARPGETWVVEVENRGNETVRTSSTVASNVHYAGGGVFVGIGVLGFVSYRMGMRRSM